MKTWLAVAIGWMAAVAAHAAPPERVVTLGGSVTEIVYQLGQGERLVGDDLSSLYPEAATRLPLKWIRLAAAAWDAGVYDGEVVAVPGVDLARDEGIRADSSLVKLGRLKAAFVDGGTVTAGNSSPLNDGASMVLLGDEAAATRLGRDPLARVVSRAAHGVDPDVFGIGPVEAANQALKRAGIDWGDLAAVELNEAFASQSLACVRQWPELDPEIVNVRGGAIAIGHPLGASGARFVGRLAHELQARGGGYGLAAICIGVGQGLAVVLHA